MFEQPHKRLYRLSPWLIRVLIPEAYIGTYSLFKHEKAELIYVGRSDTCLQKRLLQHAYVGRADYFRYNIQWTPEKAFIAECSAYHVSISGTENLIHPARPKGVFLQCPFCLSTFNQVRRNRLSCPENNFGIS